MSYAADLIAERKWYISHEVLCFEIPDKRDESEVRVWENLILIRANSPEEAYQKAIERGQFNEQPVRIDGEEGHCRFLGLRDLLLIHDELEDGAELEWSEYTVRRSDLSNFVRPKERLRVFNLEIKDDED